ncbi:MAG: peptidoglycan synthetase [Prevotellaceae bacterium]|jgi:UDP-N-acetylmuramate: L-alanyl-gamma-D-glutamyl-meso-diaminopimelate ligase|nr:peptidoglycan synthetase [Prevotellaceae bacterium]
MNRIHFIAVGGAAMHNLAIALSKEDDTVVTGSDDEIFEPSLSRLKKNGLLPDKMGWFPDERIDSGLEAVIVGMHATEDNPELIRAKELGLEIYSFPEYLYERCKNKTRVVIGGSHGKTTTTAMILYVLNKLNYHPDYMVGAQIEGFEDMVKLSGDSVIAVFEGDEYLTSPIDRRPKFHLYKPHIAVVTGIAWDHINVFPTFDIYVEQFRKFAGLIEPDGRFIYFDGDENLKTIAGNLRPDVVAFPYNTPKHIIHNGVTCLQTGKGKETALSIFGEHNLQNMEAARLVCRQIGVNDNRFYDAIKDFTGASNRLQKIAETESSVAFKDFAHSPSKLRATVKAVRSQYPDRNVIACMELHTFSSLTKDFLPQYAGCMSEADTAFVYYNPEVIRHKRLEDIDPVQVKEAFGGNNLTVFTDTELLQEKLKSLDYKNSALLMMSSGNFSGIDIEEFAGELIKSV